MIFISHSSSDAVFVNETLLQFLRSRGIESWLYTSAIKGGEAWEKSIREGLTGSDSVIVVMSKESVASKWVRAEVHWALDLKYNHLIPLLLEDCPFENLHMMLKGIQYVDFRSDHAKGFEKLASALNLIQTQAPSSHKFLAMSRGNVIHVPLFHYGGVVPPEMFSGRERELADGITLIRGGQSFLLVGDYRIGKTSYGKMLIHKIMGFQERQGNRLIGSYLNLQNCRELNAESFLEHTILSIMGEVARQVFGCKYSSLLMGNAKEAYPELANDQSFTMFENIFNFIREKTKESQSKPTNNLRPDDFVNIIVEVMELVREKGWDNFFIFFDEANRLPFSLSCEILTGNEEALRAAGVINIYAAVPRAAETDTFRNLFGHRIVLKKFERPEEVKVLLSRYYFGDPGRSNDLPVTEDALNLMWNLCSGHPFNTQLLAGESFKRAYDLGNEMLDRNHVEDAYQVSAPKMIPPSQ